jgi:hypothetical protein
MNTVLSPAETRRIAALHDQGFSERWIARRFDLSAATISRKLREIRNETASAPLPATFRPGERPPPGDETPPGYDPANIRRCRGCGALVYLWPCLACCLSEPVTTESPSTSSQI